MQNDPLFLNFDEWCIEFAKLTPSFSEKDLNWKIVTMISNLYEAGHSPEEAAKRWNEKFVKTNP